MSDEKKVEEKSEDKDVKVGGTILFQVVVP